MTTAHCLEKGREHFARIQRDPHGHAGAWVSAIYFFVAGDKHFPEGLEVLQYAIDRKMPGNMNNIVPENLKEALQVSDLLRKYATMIPPILLNFKRTMDNQKLPLGATEIHRQLLFARFHVEILEQLLLKAIPMAKGTEKKQLRAVRQTATVLTDYFLGHHVILASALELLQQNAPPDPLEGPEDLDD